MYLKIYILLRLQSNMLISKIFKFDAAHRLPDYNGKCANLHGHSWKLVVTLEGEVEQNGMIIDFLELKNKVNEKIISKLDHSYLNDLVENPTCENMLIWIKAQILELKGLKSIRLYESESSFCEL